MARALEYTGVNGRTKTVRLTGTRRRPKAKPVGATQALIYWMAQQRNRLRQNLDTRYAQYRAGQNDGMNYWAIRQDTDIERRG